MTRASVQVPLRLEQKVTQANSSHLVCCKTSQNGIFTKVLWCENNRVFFLAKTTGFGQTETRPSGGWTSDAVVTLAASRVTLGATSLCHRTGIGQEHRTQCEPGYANSSQQKSVQSLRPNFTSHPLGVHVICNDI